jgi:hypothetical protein
MAGLSGHRDVVTGLALAFADDHLELQGLALAGTPDLDHADLLGRVLPRIR